MKTTLEFLDAVKAKHGFTSDYQLSKHLECSRASISIYRAGKSFLDAEMACRIADDLGIEAGFILSCIAAERSKSPRVKAAWKHTAEMLYGLAAALLLFAVLPYAPAPNADGFNVALLGMIAPSLRTNTVYYVKFIFEYWYVFLPLFILSIKAFPVRLPPKLHKPD